MNRKEIGSNLPVKTHCRASLRMAVILLTSSFILHTSSLHAQLLTPLSHEMNRRVEYEMIKTGTPFFTVMKPYVDTQLRGNARQDSLNLFPQYGRPNRASLPRTWLTRKLLHESFIQVDSGNYYLFFDPLFDLTAGRENNGRNTFINTRGFRAGGRLGKYFAFGTDFYENQAIFNSKLDSLIRPNKIIPSQGKGKVNGNTWDYAVSTGYLSFHVSKWNVQAGQGRNFVGDGYRSHFLSDNSYPYLYVKNSWISKKWMYTWMLAELQSPRSWSEKFSPYPWNIFAMHSLSMNILKKVQLSVISTRVYDNPDTIQRMHIETQMFNPLPVRFKSDLKQLNNWGVNLKIGITQYLALYQQYALSNKKISFQAGFNWFNFLGVRGLYQQMEYNHIPKDAYQSSVRTMQWMQFGEPLGHPAGDNARELVSITSYTFKRWQIFSQLNFTGNITEQDPVSPVIKPAYPYLTTGQQLIWNRSELMFYFNRKTLMNIAVGMIYRKESRAGKTENLTQVYCSFRTSLRNLYFDR